MPAAVVAPWQSCPVHPLVGMETAAPGPSHAVSLPKTPSETFIASATVVLGRWFKLALLPTECGLLAANAGACSENHPVIMRNSV